MTSKLEKKLGSYLKKVRGDRTFSEFSKITGLKPSTLFRLENCQQSITLGKLEMLMRKLRCNLRDIFGDPAP